MHSYVKRTILLDNRDRSSSATSCPFLVHLHRLSIRVLPLASTNTARLSSWLMIDMPSSSRSEVTEVLHWNSCLYRPPYELVCQ